MCVFEALVLTLIGVARPAMINHLLCPATKIGQ